MGLRDFADKHRYDSSFAGCRISGDKIQKGAKSWPVAGAKADFEHGANVGGRVTATRVMLTGVFALAMKKDRNKVYVMVQLADGEQLLLDAKAKQEKDAREFASKVNQAGTHFAEQV